MNVVVTVGSTRFAELTDRVVSTEFIEALKHAGVQHVTIQHGDQELPKSAKELRKISGMKFKTFQYLPEMDNVISSADLVISHAGAGTILCAIRGGVKLIVVPNRSLMDDHQAQLASHLASLGVLIYGDVDSLCENLETALAKNSFALPRPNTQALTTILDEELEIAAIEEEV